MSCWNAGTVVKRKRGGKFLADLAKHGDEIMVARGGRGGVCLFLPQLNVESIKVVISCGFVLNSPYPILMITSMTTVVIMYYVIFLDWVEHICVMRTSILRVDGERVNDHFNSDISTVKFVELLWLLN